MCVCLCVGALRCQAIADVAHAQLALYAMQHEERPTVHVAATMLEGLCYSNKDRLSAGLIVAGWDKEQGGSVYNVPLGGGLFKGPWAIGGEWASRRPLCDHAPACQRAEIPSVSLSLSRLQALDRLTSMVTAMRLTAKTGRRKKRSTLSGMVRAPGGRPAILLFLPADTRLRRFLSLSRSRARASTALALAMSRDGSSGGTIRMAIITEDGVERIFVPGDQLPRFWDKA